MWQPPSSSTSSTGVPPPDSENKVEKTKDEGIVRIVRGTSRQQAEAMRLTMTAGGDKADDACKPPDEKQATMQVGGASMPGFDPDRDRLPEFTTLLSKATQWMPEVIVEIEIKKKYLTKGSVSENGWIALKCAPIEKISIFETGNKKVGGRRLPNAD